MADYFAALAARTLRPELSVQPRQRVRWEESAEPIADAFAATEKGITDAARPRVPNEGEPAHRSRRKSIAETSPQESEPVAPPRGHQPNRRKSAADEDGTNTATASTPHPTVRAVEPAVQARSEHVAARAGDMTGKSLTIAADHTAVLARVSGIDRARPLAARQLAGERQSRAEPSIRIHIGRVDVRAVTAVVPSSPPVSRDSKRALMSLDEYVQKRDRGAS